MSFKSTLKSSTFSALNSIGISRQVAGSQWRRNQLCILCYHGVAIRDEHEFLPLLFVTQEFLHRRLQILREEGCTVLALPEAVSRLVDGSLPERSVVLTFDDGFYDFYRRAVPVLEEENMVATNYVSTYYVSNQKPLFDMTLRYLLWSASMQGITQQRSGRTYDLSSLTDRQCILDVLRGEAEQMDEDRPAQYAWMEELAGQLDFDWEAFRRDRILHLMTTEEIGELSGRGMDIQLHTHRHRTPRDEALFKSEMTENQSILGDVTRELPTHFCYPSGDYDPAFVPWLKELGIESATVGDTRLCKPGDDLYRLPRFVDTLYQSEAVFRSWVSGLYDRVYFWR